MVDSGIIVGQCAISLQTGVKFAPWVVWAIRCSAAPYSLNNELSVCWWVPGPMRLI